VSHQPFLNNIALWGMSILVNPIMWQHQHTYAHHAFTNDITHDPDTHHFDHTKVKKNRTPTTNHTIPVENNNKHNDENNNNKNNNKEEGTIISDQAPNKILYVYTLFRFCMICFGLCFLRPIQFIIERSMYGRVEWNDRKRHFRTIGFIFHWICHNVLFLVVPFYVYTKPEYAWLSILFFYSGSGLLFGFASQVRQKTLLCVVCA
jgi:hypothetical protein